MAQATFVKPRNIGTKITVTGARFQAIAPSFADVVAIPLVHDWGPLGSDAPGTDKRQGGPQLLTGFDQWEELFGSGDSDGRIAVAGAFAGQGLDGAGGAGGVLVYRMGTGAVRATHNFQNTTPGDALRLDARYKGTRGNALSVVIEADPITAANDRLRLLLDGVEVQRFSYVRTDIAALAAQINDSNSPYVTATSLITGVALAVTAGTALTTGTDGAAPNAAAYDEASDAIQFKDFAILAPYNLTDPTMRAQVVAWVQEQEAANRPVRLVVGGDSGDTLATALARSAAIADPHVVNFGVGTYHDDLLDLDLTTAQLAPRIAGILAARGEDKALTFAEIAGLSIASGGVASDSLRAAADGGVTVLAQASMPDAELRINQGVTTFTAKNVPGRPYEIFSEPRFIGILDIFIRRMKMFGDAIVIGDLPVNDDTRATVRKELSNLISDLLRRGLIEPGDVARGIDPPTFDVPRVGDPSLLDAVPFTFGWQFTRTANYVIGNGTVK